MPALKTFSPAGSEGLGASCLPLYEAVKLDRFIAKLRLHQRRVKGASKAREREEVT